MKFEVTILGSSSATPIFNRNPSSQLLNINDKYFLVDCGEGTQQQLLRYNLKVQRIDNIFISHLHGDHYLGLPGLLSSLHLNGRTKEMNLYGPEALQEILEVNFRNSQTQLRYPINFFAVDPLQSISIFENYDVRISTIPLEHRIACTGFLFSGKVRLPKMDKQKVEELQIPADQITNIKKGAAFTDKRGVVHPATSLTIEPEKPKVFAYCSDTICNWKYLNLISGADLLYHEATFMHDMLERATETFHTTALQAGEIAVRAGVKRLLIGHFSARYRDLEPVLQEARGNFKETVLAIEGLTFRL